MTARRGRVVVHHPPAKLRGRAARPVSRASAAATLRLVETAVAAVTEAREGATRLLGPGSPVGHAVTDALLALGEAREDLEELVEGGAT